MMSETSCSHSHSWRVDETHIIINGRWFYFYRAIDSYGITLDIELRKHRDYQSAYHFLKRLMATKNHQCSKYCNNLIEQDHRLIKNVCVKSSGFQSLRMISKVLNRIEVMYQQHKAGQRELNLFGLSSLKSLIELLVN